MHAIELSAQRLVSAVPLPTPTDPAFDPADVTPGPIGFIFTIVFMVAVGLLVMSLMTRMSRMNARYQVREELEAEERAKQPQPASDSEPPATQQPDSGDRVQDDQ